MIKEGDPNYKRWLSCKVNFIKKARAVHGNLYDYSLVEYINAKLKVDIICEKHGVFHQTPNSHLCGSGCSYCKGYFIHRAKRHNVDIFVKKATIVHGDKYDYSNVVYYNAREKVDIICPIHGLFKQAPHLHLRGENCPACKESIGESRIATILNKNNIIYEREKKFDSCKIKKKLRFDFYLIKYNIIIEFQGEQHYEIIDGLGGLKSYMKIRRNDEYKKRWALENKITLLEYNKSHSDRYIWNSIKNAIRNIK